MNSPAHLSLSSSEQMGKNKPCVMCCDQPSLPPARDTACTEGRARQPGPSTAMGTSCGLTIPHQQWGSLPALWLLQGLRPWLSHDTRHGTFPQTAFHLWLNIARLYHNLKAAGKEIFLSWQLQFFLTPPALKNKPKLYLLLLRTSRS